MPTSHVLCRLLILLLLAMSAIVKPAMQTALAQEPQFSGYLSDYSGFVPGKEDEGLWIYRDPKIDVGVYSKVKINPVVVFLSPKASQLGVRPDELKQLADYLRQAAIVALRDSYQIVDQPGEGVLLLRAALTNVVPVIPCLSIVSNIPSPVRALSTCRRIIQGEYPFVGVANVEVEMLDSLTQRRIVAVIDEKTGQQTLGKQHSRWADVRRAFDEWALRLGTKLAEARQRVERKDRVGSAENQNRVE